MGAAWGGRDDAPPVVVRQVVSWPVPIVMVAPPPVVTEEVVATPTPPVPVAQEAAPTTRPGRKPTEPTTAPATPAQPDPNQVRIDALLP